MPRCVNGHEVNEGSETCQLCGVAVAKSVPPIPISVVQRRKSGYRLLIVAVILIAGIVLIMRLSSSASTGGLNLQSSSCSEYDAATNAQQVAFVQTWDDQLSLYSNPNALQQGLTVMQDICEGELSNHPADEPIGEVLADNLFIAP